jgi:hypothetical protein
MQVDAIETEFNTSLQEYLMTLDEVADTANEVALAQKAYDDAVKASGEDSAAAKEKLAAL